MEQEQRVLLSGPCRVLPQHALLSSATTEGTEDFTEKLSKCTNPSNVSQLSTLNSIMTSGLVEHFFLQLPCHNH